MIFLILSATIAFISGIATQLVELVKFKSNIQKGYFKKRIKWGSFICFVIAFFVSIYQIKVENDKKLEERSNALKNSKEDSVRRIRDSLQIVKLITKNQGLQSSVDQANHSLDTIRGINTTLLIDQSRNFKNTADRIAKSANTLLNYIDGKGYGYIYIGINPNSLSSFFVLNNPNQFPLRSCNIIIMPYKYIDSVIQFKNNFRVFDKDKFRSYATLIIDRPLITSGISTTNVRADFGPETTYLISLTFNGEDYYEELVVNPKVYSFKLYKEMQGKIELIKESQPAVPIKLWNKVFPISLENLKYGF